MRFPKLCGSPPPQGSFKQLNFTEALRNLYCRRDHLDGFEISSWGGGMGVGNSVTDSVQFLILTWRAKLGEAYPLSRFLLLLFPAQYLEVISNFGRTPDENLPQADGFTAHPRGLSDLSRIAAFFSHVSSMYMRKELQRSTNVAWFACAESIFTFSVPLYSESYPTASVELIAFSLRNCLLHTLTEL